ncbi:hypothetical protein GH714_031503 [Hevea brasiliensis]|uniref:Uncharacterized protein n=1 Tax=Hevea brasiliensis TaxID=3981 RepID=A0A6A6LI84_HEVBR|nr:hypothetical protein GH714_031503 [Hevea brasiliensis]
MPLKELQTVACGLLAAWAVTTASPVIAASQAFVGNTIGQANGVYDKPIDLRFCDYTNEKSNLKGKSLAAALMSDAKFDGADMSEVVMSRLMLLELASRDGHLSILSVLICSYQNVHDYDMGLNGITVNPTIFAGVDFSNAVLDRVNFGKANLQGAVFKNAVLSGSTFDEAQLADAVFEDTIIGYIDLQKLCTNTTIDSEGRASLGCR